MSNNISNTNNISSLIDESNGDEKNNPMTVETLQDTYGTIILQKNFVVLNFLYLIIYKFLIIKNNLCIISK